MRNKKLCPYCHHPLRYGQICQYILHGTHYAIKCDECGRKLRPTKYPLTFGRCYIFALIFTVLSMNLMLHVFHFSFMKALICFLGAAVILFLLLSVAVVLTTEFDSE